MSEHYDSEGEEKKLLNSDEIADILSGMQDNSFRPDQIGGNPAQQDYGFDTELDMGMLESSNQERIRSANQSGWDMLKNASINAAAEITMGTLEGASYLLDVEQHYNLAKGTEQEFGIWRCS